MTTKEIELASLFTKVTKELQVNQENLNEADTYNHNHGDNMVQNFKVITKALKQKGEASPSEQLAYASQILKKRSASGSAQLYAEGLANAAEAVRGQPAITPENAMGLIQALMGGGQTAQPSLGNSQSASGDLLGSLVGSMLGGGLGSGSLPSGENQQPENPGDLLGSLLGGAMGTPSHPQSDNAPSGGMEDLLGSLLGGAMGAPSQQSNDSQPGGGMGDLLGSLLGGGLEASQPSSGSQTPDNMGDLIGSLLGGGMQPASAAAHTSQPQSGDMIGNLLGSLLGGTTGSSPQSGQGSQSGSGLDLSTLLMMGMAYMQAKQQGASTMEAILKVLMSGSQMNNTAYHSQSGQLVAGTLLNAIGALMGSK